MTKTKILTLSAMMTALTVVFFFLGAVMPTMCVSFAALAGICAVPCVLSGGKKAGVLFYSASATLGVLLTSASPTALLFCFIFGGYATYKFAIEQAEKRIVLSLFFKFIYANIVYVCLFFVFLKFVPSLGFDLSETSKLNSEILIILVYNVMFVIYDLFLTAFAKKIRRTLKLED